MLLCRPRTPLSALVESANGKVQGLLGFLALPAPTGLFDASSCSVEWEGSTQTESTGFSLVFFNRKNKLA